MSKASERRAARGENWFVVDRQAARRIAFAEGLRLVQKDPDFRQKLVDGTAPNWRGMSILSNPEKAKVRLDVLQFAKASDAEREGAINGPVLTAKRPFVERVKRAFQSVLGT